MRQNFIAQFVQFLKHWLWDAQSGIVVEENWAHSVDHCWLQVVQFWCIIDLPRLHYLLRYITSVPLRCTGFARIQKAVVDHTGSRPPNSDHDLCGASLASGSVLGSFFSVQPELVISSGHIQSTSFHHTSQSNQEMVHCYCVE